MVRQERTKHQTRVKWFMAGAIFLLLHPISSSFGQSPFGGLADNMEAVTAARYAEIARFHTLDRTGPPDYPTLLSAWYIQNHFTDTSPEKMRDDLTRLRDQFNTAEKVADTPGAYRWFPEGSQQLAGAWCKAVGNAPGLGKQLAGYCDVLDAFTNSMEYFGEPDARKQAQALRGFLVNKATEKVEETFYGLRDKYISDPRFKDYRPLVDDFVTPGAGVRPQDQGIDLVTRSPVVRQVLERHPDAAAAASKALGVPGKVPPQRLSTQDQQQLRFAVQAELKQVFEKYSQQEKENRERLRQMNEAHDIVGGLGVLSSLIDKDFGRAVAKLGNAALDASDAISRFRLPDGSAGKIGAAAMTCNILSAFSTLLSLIGGPGLDQMILEEVHAIRKEVAQLRVEMHGRFDRIDRTLYFMYGELGNRMDRVEAILAVNDRRNAERSDLILESQSQLHDWLSEFERRQVALFGNLERKELRLVIDSALANDFRKIKPTASDRMKWLTELKEGVTNANSEAIAGAGIRFDPRLGLLRNLGQLSDAASDRLGFPASADAAGQIRLLAEAERLFGGTPAALDTPNPAEWNFLSEAYLAMADDMDGFEGEVRPSMTNAYIDGGRRLLDLLRLGGASRRDALRLPLADPASTNQVWGVSMDPGGQPLFSHLVQLYAWEASDLDALLWKHQRAFESRRETLNGYDVFSRLVSTSTPQNSAPEFSRLEIQPTRDSTANVVQVPGDLAPAVFGKGRRIDEVLVGREMPAWDCSKAMPAGDDAALLLSKEEASTLAKRYVPELFLHAQAMNAGQLKFVIDSVNWTERHDVVTARSGGGPIGRVVVFDDMAKLQVGFRCVCQIGSREIEVFKLFVTSPSEERKGIHGTVNDKVVHAKELLMLPEIYRARWEAELKPMLLKGEGVTHRLSIAERRRSLEEIDAIVKDKIDKARADFLKDLAAQFNGDTEIRQAARRVTGAKALIDAFLRLSFPQMLADDAVRAQMYGTQPGLLDLDALLVEIKALAEKNKRAETALGKTDLGVISDLHRGGVIEARFRGFVEAVSKADISRTDRLLPFERTLLRLEDLAQRQRAAESDR